MSRGRSAASIVLTVLAAASVAVGGTCLYLREDLLNSKRFADRTVAAIDNPAVRRLAAREIVTQAIDRAHPDLLAARPVINSVVEAVVASPPFRSILRAAADHAHRLFFDRGGNAVFSIADAGKIVISALSSLAPNVAAEIPPGAEARLLDVQRRSFAGSTLRAAETIRTLGLVLPLAALALFALTIALAPRRRLAVTRCALALAVVGLAVFADLALLRSTVISHLYGAEELSNADVRAAAGGLWDAYFQALSRWALGVAIAGAIVAAAAASVVGPYPAVANLVRIRGRVWPPRTRAGEGLVGAGALAAGTVFIGWPTLGIDIVVVGCGLVLIYVGAGELLSAIGAAPEPRRPSRTSARAAIAGSAAALALLIGGAAIALAASSETKSRPPALAQLTCNGYEQLCSRRVEQVVFAGTHNSMSAADTAGWLIANQTRDITRQLEDGIRAFKISTHYGVSDGRGHVLTDVTAEGARVNRVTEHLSPEGRASLQRLSSSIGFGSPKGKPSVWLCHTQCEVGATRMAAFLGVVARFLRENPGQVLIFFDEDYVSEQSLEDEFKRAGLFSHLAVLRTGQQLPTLGELVRSQHNVLVFTQEPVSGKHPWDMYGFSFIQDTPLGAVKPSEFTCRLFRGVQSNPLLMMNNWADVFPPRRSPNLPLLTRAFILERAKRCESERHHIPNIVLTDFYDSGDVIGAVRVLNGLGEQAPAPIVPLRG